MSASLTPRRPWIFICCIPLLIASSLILAQAEASRKPNELLKTWYQQPAQNGLNEALPIGNGRLGGLLFGIPDKEKVVLSEDSLWTGNENPSGEDSTMGAFQMLATLGVQLDGHESVADYRRELDLSDAIAKVTYRIGQVNYEREAFASHPAEVLVLHFTASKPGSYTGTIDLSDAHQAPVTVTKDGLLSTGRLSNNLKYETQVAVLHKGGKLVTENGKLECQRCDSFTILIAAGTDYAMDFAHHYRGPDPHPGLTATLHAAEAKSYAELKAEHLADYQSLFNRVSIDLGKSTEAQRQLPTNLRKEQAHTTPDPELEALLFQFGRYLLISSSRPGGLPANLQGLWNDTNTPAWHSDYHSNINIEMNYWPAEVTNLAECQLPFFDLVRSQLPAWRQTTATSPELLTPSGEKSRRGFAIRTSHNIMGGMGWKWDRTANAWYAQDFWEHYAFGLDKKYLRELAYPYLKEVTEFWEDHLKALPDGRLVVPNAWSPEHGPVQDGVSYSQEIVWDLFTNYVEAADALSVDKDYRNKIAAMRAKLVTPGIGSWGQLREWMTELHDPVLDTPNDHHRHTSHLFGLYPGRQFSVLQTPDLAAAARKTLIARGNTGDVREWSFAWRTALWARLQDAETAHEQIMELFSDRNTTPNLFGLHPPMQIDGDFGVTAAIAEMLLQSQTGAIQLLPALPHTWSNGSVTGLRARGGYQIDMSWKDGKLTTATIHGSKNQTGKVVYGEIIREFVLPANGSIRLGSDFSIVH